MNQTVKADFRVENHGSIFLLRPLSKEGEDWAKSHLPDDAQTFGNAVAVEPRYINDIVNGICDDGLVVS
jgi:hypothetical protein